MQRQEVRGKYTSWEENRWGGNRKQSNHSDRLIRRRDDHSRNYSNGGGCFRPGPYDWSISQLWKEKTTLPERLNGEQYIKVKGAREEVRRGDSGARVSAGREETSSRLVVPYEQTAQQTVPASTREGKRSETTGTRKISSAIVSPLGLDYPMNMEDNVTLRNRVEGQNLTFSSSDRNDSGIKDDQMIEALTDMESMDQTNGGMMDDEIEGDDLLGLDLMEMEDSSSLPATKEVG